MPTENVILVINSGSSSLKFALYSIKDSIQALICEGLAQSLNQETGNLSLKTDDDKQEYEINLRNDTPHAVALNKVIELLEAQFQIKDKLIGIGHRVVHGGSRFSQSALINDQVISEIKACTPLAPLHNPANVLGIELMVSLFPDVKQVAVFDTAFHQTLPPHAYLYGLPYSFYKENDIRKYGFHGSSHRCIAILAAKQLDSEENKINIINAHLGNGASVAAISKGKSLDTSMGMTPLEGLIMGTRSGDIDPGIFDYLMSLGHSPEDISNILNKKSGLLGLSEQTNDMRTICDNAEQGHQQSQFALDVFCFRAAKHIAGMMTSLSTLDALVFTGGIGENSSLVRAKICEHLSIFNIKLNNEINTKPKDFEIENKPGINLAADNSIPVLLIPTDEEAIIVSDTLNIISEGNEL